MAPLARRSCLLLALPAVLVAGLLVFFGARAWVNGFLRSDDFRHFLERKASAALHVGGRFAPLHWQGAEVYSDAFDATGAPGSPWSRLAVEQARARLDLSALWRRAWRVERVEAEKVAAVLNAPDLARPDREAAAAVRPEGEHGDGFPANLLPSRVEIGEARVNNFSLDWRSGRLSGTRLTARPSDGSGMRNWEINGDGGRLEQAHFPALALTGFHAKSNPHEIFITSATGRSDAGGQLELAGRQGLDGDRPLDLTANFDGVAVGDFLPEDWRARLHGAATGIVHITGSGARPDQLRVQGKVDLRDGRLEALPVLDQLALLTASARFRQIPLQKGHAEFEWTPNGLTVSKLLVESEGLLRIEGGFTVRGDRIDGALQVGVARGSLRWVAAVAARVFNEPDRDGYAWTTMRLTGAAQHPTEDLTPRMIAAAQGEVIDKAKQGAGTVIDTAAGLLDLLKGH